MVGLHVQYHQITWFSSCQFPIHVVHPFVDFACVNCVHYRNLVVVDEVGIVSHAVFEHILAFKKCEVGVVDTDVFDRIWNEFFGHRSENEKVWLYMFIFECKVLQKYQKKQVGGA